MLQMFVRRCSVCRAGKTANHTYYSFFESGLLKELEASTKFVPDYKLKERMRKQIEEEVQQKNRQEEKRAMAKIMKVKEIAELTGLSKLIIQHIKI